MTQSTKGDPRPDTAKHDLQVRKEALKKEQAAAAASRQEKALGARRCLRPAGDLPVGAIQRSQARASSLIGGLQVKPQPRRSDRNFSPGEIVR